MHSFGPYSLRIFIQLGENNGIWGGGGMLIGNLLKKSELLILKINANLIFYTGYFVLHFKRLWDHFAAFKKKCVVSFPVAAFGAWSRLTQ